MKKTALITALIMLLSLWCPASGDTDTPEPARPAKPAKTVKPGKPGKSVKCPVCGMFVYKYPDWVSALVLPRGDVLYFDGAKDLFRYLKDATGKTEKVSSVWVTEYYGLTMIDASAAFYVIGSDIYGPMGRELIPFASEDEAREFMRDHSGKSILTFDEVDAAILKRLK